MLKIIDRLFLIDDSHWRL